MDQLHSSLKLWLLNSSSQNNTFIRWMSSGYFIQMIFPTKMVHYEYGVKEVRCHSTERLTLGFACERRVKEVEEECNRMRQGKGAAYISHRFRRKIYNKHGKKIILHYYMSLLYMLIQIQFTEKSFRTSITRYQTLFMHPSNM